MSQCYRCGRALPEIGGHAFLFGRLCDRRDCHAVATMLSNRWRWFWFRASPPADPGDPGRAAAFSLEGEYQYPRGYDESSLQTLIDANRLREERGSA